MGTRNFFVVVFLILAASCGQDQKFENNKLEAFSNIIVPTSTKVDKDGVLNKSASSTSSDTLTFDDKKYTISKYSSQLALNFVNRAVKGSTVTVRFNGDVMGGEILLKIIEAK